MRTQNAACKNSCLQSSLADTAGAAFPPAYQAVAMKYRGALHSECDKTPKMQPFGSVGARPGGYLEEVLLGIEVA